MSMCWFITTLSVTAFFSSPAYAYDPNPLQEICVPVNDSKTAVFVNGKICKDPKLAKADDFFASGLNVSGNAVPGFGFAIKTVDVNNMPGLNTLGISIIRVDLEPQHPFALHTHPRASALMTILEGTLYAGFFVPDAANFFKSHLFSKILNPRDVFVYPQGLIHFVYNVGHKKATFLASLNSQNP
ncbi:germin-like protein subfamily 1 member 19 [Lycium ferocissimum]|uniref:germin-like protein subfamily 1 member 19 n=1 Tax=Lycium ferocissimum TaxID=112874 RepID=UPI00281688AC|nr:germin-like protein subfamily 1 member 19 [Lycium ferocissimum]